MKKRQEIVIEKKKERSVFPIIGISVVVAFLLVQIAASLFIEVATQPLTFETAVNSNEAKDVSFFGNLAPQFELQSLSGKKVRVSEFVGKPLIVLFWTTENKESVAEMKELVRGVTENPDSSLALVFINSQEDPSIVRNFIERGGYSVDTLLDVDGSVSDLYRVRTVPALYFVNEKGIVLEKTVGKVAFQKVVDNMERLTKNRVLE